MEDRNTHRHVAAALDDGYVSGGSFFGSILSGMLLGFVADRWLHTAPLLVVIGGLLGVYSGFMQMWRLSAKLEEPRER